MRSSLIPSHDIWILVQGLRNVQNSLGTADSEAEPFSWKTLRKTHGFTHVNNMSKGNVLFVPLKKTAT